MKKKQSFVNFNLNFELLFESEILLKIIRNYQVCDFQLTLPLVVLLYDDLMTTNRQMCHNKGKKVYRTVFRKNSRINLSREIAQYVKRHGKLGCLVFIFVHFILNFN